MAGLGNNATDPYVLGADHHFTCRRGGNPVVEICQEETYAVAPGSTDYLTVFIDKIYGMAEGLLPGYYLRRHVRWIEDKRKDGVDQT